MKTIKLQLQETLPIYDSNEKTVVLGQDNLALSIESINCKLATIDSFYYKLFMVVNLHHKIS